MRILPSLTPRLTVTNTRTGFILFHPHHLHFLLCMMVPIFDCHCHAHVSTTIPKPETLNRMSLLGRRGKMSSTKFVNIGAATSNLHQHRRCTWPYGLRHRRIPGQNGALAEPYIAPEGRSCLLRLLAIITLTIFACSCLRRFGFCVIAYTDVTLSNLGCVFGGHCPIRNHWVVLVVSCEETFAYGRRPARIVLRGMKSCLVMSYRKYLFCMMLAKLAHSSECHACLANA